jgi:hypothetical protein
MLGQLFGLWMVQGAPTWTEPRSSRPETVTAWRALRRADEGTDTGAPRYKTVLATSAPCSMRPPCVAAEDNSPPNALAAPAPAYDAGFRRRAARASIAVALSAGASDRPRGGVCISAASGFVARCDSDEQRALVGQEPAFALDAAAVAAQCAVGCDDAVTRDDERHRVASVGGADGAHCVGAADFAREHRV